MRIVYYYRHLNDPLGSGAHAASLVREWETTGNDVYCLPHPLRRSGRPGRPSSPASPPLAAEPPGALSAGPPRSLAAVPARLLATVPPAVRHRLRFVQDDLRSRREAPRLLGHIGAWRPDVLIARHSDFDRTLDRLVDGVRCPVVAEVNAVVHLEWRHLLGHEQPKAAVRREVAFLQRADFRICVSEEVCQEVLTLGADPARCAVVPNGADCDLFSPEAPWDEGLTAWLAGRPGPLVAYCGSAGWVHDTDTLLGATERLADAEPGSLFLFVGPLEGPVDALRQRAPHLAPRVLVTGAVPHDRVPSYLAPADLVWAAYRTGHVSPLKVFEYFAMGKPVVAAGSGQVRHLLQAARCGTPVPAASPEDLAAAAVTILSLSPDARAELGSAARRWAVENGSWSLTATTMLSLVEEKVLKSWSQP